MRFITITIFAVTSRLVALVTANPIPDWSADGVAIPIARHSFLPNSNQSISLDAISSHGILVREKILRSLDNYKMNTGSIHPFAVKRSESELEARGASLPLTKFQDDIWSAEISIGTPPKTFKVQIDTGAADLWVLGTGCHGVSGDHNFWDPESSHSVSEDDYTFQLEYGGGVIVEGDLYLDHVTIGGFTAELQTFGSATSFTSSLTHEYPADGSLGLAFPSVSSFHSYPLFESLVRQNKLINPTFSLKLTTSGAEMYVGGANSMLYSGEITYTPLTTPGLWEVSMDDVRVYGKTILKNVPVIFDTGTGHIFGDWNGVAALYTRLSGTLQVHRGYGFYYLPCNSFPTIILTFGGKPFEIPPENFRLGPIAEGSPNCFGSIIAQREEYWNIGMTFLQNVYSVFDFAHMQVGFAKLA